MKNVNSFLVMTKDNRSTFYMLQLNSGIVISPNASEKLS